MGEPLWVAAMTNNLAIHVFGVSPPTDYEQLWVAAMTNNLEIHVIGVSTPNDYAHSRT